MISKSKIGQFWMSWAFKGQSNGSPYGLSLTHITPWHVPFFSQIANNQEELLNKVLIYAPPPTHTQTRRVKRVLIFHTFQ